MKTALLLSICLLHFSAKAQRRGVYSTISAALSQPDKVRVLDLRGQRLSTLPDSLNSMRNVEAILLGMKRRPLLFYPPAWKYKLHLKRLPAGGYLHLMRRSSKNFYFFNHFANIPLDFCRFTKLRVVDIGGGMNFDLADTVACRLAWCRPQVIVLGGSTHKRGNTDIEQELTESWRRRREARIFLRQFKVE